MNYCQPDTLISMRDVTRLTALSRSEIYRRLKKQEFPPPIRIGQRRVAWRVAHIRDWISDMEEFGRWIPPVRADPPDDVPF